MWCCVVCVIFILFLGITPIVFSTWCKHCRHTVNIPGTVFSWKHRARRQDGCKVIKCPLPVFWEPAHISFLLRVQKRGEITVCTWHHAGNIARWNVFSTTEPWDNNIWQSFTFCWKCNGPRMQCIARVICQHVRRQWIWHVSLTWWLLCGWHQLSFKFWNQLLLVFYLLLKFLSVSLIIFSL